MHFTAVFLQTSLGYVGFVGELPGANTQGNTLEEARADLREAVELVLNANRDLAEESIRGQTAIREAFVIPSE
jgi:predicted RNase H-like HicB family nuclease